jgi:Molecular chaperone, HSP90 family
MTEQLISYAEKKAELAENLAPFSGFKLLHVRKQIKLILGQIGRGEIFEEYTKHDISHIDSMLNSLEWIVPDETKEVMSPTDWLLIVLSIYFHDMGMLVTKHEYENRYKSAFSNFKHLIANGEFSVDFIDKVNLLGDEKKEKFLFQEFVRKTHAERIKYWILDDYNQTQVNNIQIITELKQLLSNLDPMFRRDLGIVCESHHLNDLDDFNKYKISQPYGNSKDEEANLHYAALILRTADLLHITSDRTPTIEFNLISPSDPLSQEEWCKQKAVKSVRPEKIVVDNDNKKKKEIDTIEVHAYFEKSEGFFALVSYLNYAQEQINKSYSLNSIAKLKHGSSYNFPWRRICDENIETVNFEKRQFAFSLDQNRILDLLVGHTLYNDSSVVLRELSQNSIDAVKLQKLIYEIEGKQFLPKVNISWNSDKKELSFIDNGTGMTLDVIENHLLKVGSSRYQDENFKKKYPDFSSISRFGIGLLTCFLIANDLDIITKSPENEKAIKICIRKVHGKYLLQYLSLNEIPNLIKEHGTEIKLFLRSDVDLSKIKSDLKKWIIFPNCEFNLSINNENYSIGFKTPKDFLISILSEKGYNNVNYKVEETTKNGITLAYVLKYIPYFKEWTYFEYYSRDDENMELPVGTCIEGIRVDFNTPGFRGKKFVSIANSTGKNAPKTNVARSNIENTAERNNLLQTIYDMYLYQIQSQIEDLYKTKSFSKSWAVHEANYLLAEFLDLNKYSQRDNEIVLEDEKIFLDSVNKLKCILIEEENSKNIMNVQEIINLNHFWTVDSSLFNSADSLLKEIPSSNMSSLALINTLFSDGQSKIDHIDRLYCNFSYDGIIKRNIIEKFQVDQIITFQEQRRVDLRWIKTDKKIWYLIDGTYNLLPNYRNSKSRANWYIQLLDIDIKNINNEIAVGSRNEFFILKGSKLNAYLVHLINHLNIIEVRENNIAFSKVIDLINRFFIMGEIEQSKIEEYINYVIERDERDLGKFIWRLIDRNELIQTLIETKFEKYDLNMWSRSFWF